MFQERTARPGGATPAPGAGSSLRSASGRKKTRTLRAAGLGPASEKNARVRTVLGQQGRPDVAARTEEGGSLRSCAQRAARPNRKGVPGATSHSRGRPAGGDPAFPRRREERGLGGRRVSPPHLPRPPLPGASGPSTTSCLLSRVRGSHPLGARRPQPPRHSLRSQTLSVLAPRLGLGQTCAGGRGARGTPAQCAPGAVSLELRRGSKAEHRC